MIPKDEWVWYGFAGHFIGGLQCAYHLCTRIDKLLVSTVGAYYPKGAEDEPMTPLGIEPDSLYESFIFPCDGEDEYGNPNIIEFSEIHSQRYDTSIKAELGHRELCLKVAKDELWRADD